MLAGLLMFLALMYLVLAVLLWDKRKQFREMLRPGGNRTDLLFSPEEELFIVLLWIGEFVLGVYVLTLLQTADGSRLTFGKILLDCVIMLVLPQGKVSVLDIYIMLNMNKARKKAIKAAQAEKEAAEEQAGKNPGQ